MQSNAVWQLEIKTRMRSWRAPAIITTYLTLLGGIFLMIYYVTYLETARQSSDIGTQMFAILASLQFILVNFAVPALTAGVISGERERQTLDVLLTTRLSPIKIIIGKLAAALSFVVLLIISSLPLFSLVFLMGGVSPGHISRVFAVYFFISLYFGSMGVFYSTLIKKSQMATVLTYLTMLLQYSLTYIIPTFYREIVDIGRNYLDLPVAFFFNPLTLYLEALIPNREADRFLLEIAHVKHNVSGWALKPEWLTLAILTGLLILLIYLSTRLLNPLNKFRK